jgi:hypothetical protein
MMHTVLYVVIAALGIACYTIGVIQILRGKFRPSVFSRMVWFLLSLVSFLGVLASQGTSSSILMAGLAFLGCTLIFTLSFWKGSKTFGKLEYICLALLVLSVLVWVIFQSPLASLLVTIFADLVGGIPTLQKVWKNPSSESVAFWGLFALAGLLSLLDSYGSPWTTFVFPLYIVLFDGIVFFLCLRKKVSLSYEHHH